MEIRIRESGQVMYESEFRSYLQENNGPTYETLTTELAEELGVDFVLEGPQASPTRYQVAYRNGVEQIEGKWYTKYSVNDLDEDAKIVVDNQHATSIREQRNKLLSDSDWTQLADSSADKIKWAKYRQALRDITKQTGFPWDIEWPSNDNV
jgi:hypothetical protein